MMDVQEEIVSEMDELLSELSRAFRTVRRRGAEPLTGAQFYLLRLLAHHGRMRISDVAQQMGITPGAVTGLTDKMVASGYIRRDRSEDDRRVVYVEIVEAGRRALQEMQAARLEHVRTLTQRLQPQELEELVRLLRKLRGEPTA